VGIASAKQDAFSENRSVSRPGDNRSVSTQMTLQPESNMAGSPGSLDGDGAGDHDEQYRFGGRPRASVPYPFSTRQFARLLIFRSRLQDQLCEDGEAAPYCCPGAAA
jgi:hypothetical protein